ncbi:MAG: hypothetical protein QOJ50_2324, partial [Cryptosporangiaceae bacterium]|nr:hypothetical protein [Cryptosporangiaceae bacterium]
MLLTAVRMWRRVRGIPGERPGCCLSSGQAPSRVASGRRWASSGVLPLGTPRAERADAARNRQLLLATGPAERLVAYRQARIGFLLEHSDIARAAL